MPPQKNQQFRNSHIPNINLNLHYNQTTHTRVQQRPVAHREMAGKHVSFESNGARFENNASIEKANGKISRHITAIIASCHEL